MIQSPLNDWIHQLETKPLACEPFGDISYPNHNKQIMLFWNAFNEGFQAFIQIPQLHGDFIIASHLGLFTKELPYI
jgi:hypothetical protein